MKELLRILVHQNRRWKITQYPDTMMLFRLQGIDSQGENWVYVCRVRNMTEARNKIKHFTQKLMTMEKENESR